MSEKKCVRFIVTADCAKSGVSNKGKPYRVQAVLVHQGDEVRKIENFLRDNEPFLTPGEYVLAPDAVYVDDVVGEDGRARPTLRVAQRFVPAAAVADKFLEGSAKLASVK